MGPKKMRKDACSLQLRDVDGIGLEAGGAREFKRIAEKNIVQLKNDGFLKMELHESNRISSSSLPTLADFDTKTMQMTYKGRAYPFRLTKATFRKLKHGLFVIEENTVTNASQSLEEIFKRQYERFLRFLNKRNEGCSDDLTRKQNHFRAFEDQLNASKTTSVHYVRVETPLLLENEAEDIGADLSRIVADMLSEKFPDLNLEGIKTSYEYYGATTSATAKHFEDGGGLNSYNHVYSPDTFKVWLFTQPEIMETLFETVANYMGERNRKLYMPHRNPFACKKIFITTDLLDDLCMPYRLVVQNPGDIIVTASRALHQVLSFVNDCNLICMAKAANFVLLDYLETVGTFPDGWGCTCPESDKDGFVPICSLLPNFQRAATDRLKMIRDSEVEVAFVPDFRARFPSFLEAHQIGDNRGHVSLGQTVVYWFQERATLLQKPGFSTIAAPVTENLTENLKAELTTQRMSYPSVNAIGISAVHRAMNMDAICKVQLLKTLIEFKATAAVQLLAGSMGSWEHLEEEEVDFVFRSFVVFQNTVKICDIYSNFPRLRQKFKEILRSGPGSRKNILTMLEILDYKHGTPEEIMEETQVPAIDEPEPVTIQKIGKTKNPAKSRGRQFPCRRCSRIYLSNGARTKHFQSYHNESPFVCEFCMYSFASKQSVTRHLTVSGCPNIICGKCGKWMYFQTAKEEHELRCQNVSV